MTCYDKTSLESAGHDDKEAKTGMATEREFEHGREASVPDLVCTTCQFVLAPTRSQSRHAEMTALVCPAVSASEYIIDSMTREVPSAPVSSSVHAKH